MGHIIKFRGRMDGVLSTLTGQGTSRDKGESFQYLPDRRVNRLVLDNLYAQHEICHRIVDLLPDDAFRKWIDINHDRSKDILAVMDDVNTVLGGDDFLTGLRGVCSYAARMSVLHGAAIVLLDIDDGHAMDEPVDIQRINSIHRAEVIECYYVQPDTRSRSRFFEHYQINSDTFDYPRVHRDRVLVFYGTKVSRDWMLTNQGWPIGRVERAIRALFGYSMAHGAVPTIVSEFMVDVFKVFGLNEMSLESSDIDGSDGPLAKGFKKKMEFMSEAKGIVQGLVMDTQDEWIKNTSNVTGLDDLIRKAEMRLVAATGIPHTKLLGESPGASLSQSGSSQEKDWHKSVEAYQQDYLTGPINKAMKYFAASLGIYDQVPWEWMPLGTPTELEKAEILQKAATAMAALIRAGVLLNDEVANSLFGGSKFSLQIQLDPALRNKKQAEAEAKQQAELQLQQQAPMLPPPVAIEPMDSFHVKDFLQLDYGTGSV